MNEKGAADKHPYICPGGKVDLPAGANAVLEHMTYCARLQGMIVIGRTRHKARCKKDEDLRTAKLRQCLARSHGIVFVQVQGIARESRISA